MKLNRKGFTLIELLAVVIVLGLVMTIVFSDSIDVFKNAKLKSEEAFLDRLSQSIDSYIELNTDKITFNGSFTGNKSKGESSYEVQIAKGTETTMSDVINDKIITASDYINPSNKIACNINAEIEVYRDEDFVYCHKVKKDSLGCLTDEYKNSIGAYAIDTCIWTEE